MKQKNTHQFHLELCCWSALFASASKPGILFVVAILRLDPRCSSVSLDVWRALLMFMTLSVRTHTRRSSQTPASSVPSSRGLELWFRQVKRKSHSIEVTWTSVLRWCQTEDRSAPVAAPTVLIQGLVTRDKTPAEVTCQFFSKSQKLQNSLCKSSSDWKYLFAFRVASFCPASVYVITFTQC